MDTLKSKVLYILETDLGLTLGSYDDELELDSMEEVELVMWIEEEFRITILDEDIDNLDTVNNIMRYISEKNIQANDYL